MQCPKCGHRQRDEIRCEACGIYFSKLSGASTRSRPAAHPVATRQGGLGPVMVVLLALAGVGAWWSQRPPSEKTGLLPELTARENAANRTLAWQDQYEMMSEQELRAEKKRLDSAPTSNENTRRMEWVRLALKGYDTQPGPARPQLAGDPNPRSEEERMRDQYRNSASELGRVQDEAQIDEAMRRTAERNAADERHRESLRNPGTPL